MPEATEDLAHDELKKARAEQIKNNEAKMAYDAKQRPTPSPDEMLAAHAGKNVMEKESSGAVSQDPNDPPHMRLDPHLRKNGNVKRAASAEGHDAAYQTRTSGAAATKDHK